MLLALMLSSSAWAAVLIHFVIFLVIVCAVAAIVCKWILPAVGAPAVIINIVWAIAGVIVLVYLLEVILPAFGM